MMNTLRLVLGWIMVAIALYLVVHLVWSRGTPQTPSIWLDIAFAVLFLLRGLMNLRAKRRAQSATR